MSTAIIQSPLNDSEILQLKKEFPTLKIVILPRTSNEITDPLIWKTAEILFSSKLSKETLLLAKELRWIHTDGSSLSRLCLKEIKQEGNILITNTTNNNASQTAEFVFSAVLAYAKNLFHYKEADHFPALLADCKWRQDMWTLKNKTFLQVGMGATGSLIAKRAKSLEMKVYTLDDVETYSPYSIKSFSFNDLLKILPSVDVLSIFLGEQKKSPFLLTQEFFSLMKKDSILSIIGPPSLIDEEALYNEAALKGKFRGILIDSSFETPISPKSKLWSLPNILITPDVAARPKNEKKEAFQIFRYNLRQFLHENFTDMKNLIDPSIIETEKMFIE